MLGFLRGCIQATLVHRSLRCCYPAIDRELGIAVIIHGTGSFTTNWIPCQRKEALTVRLLKHWLSSDAQFLVVVLMLKDCREPSWSSDELPR